MSLLTIYRLFISKTITHSIPYSLFPLTWLGISTRQIILLLSFGRSKQSNSERININCHISLQDIYPVKAQYRLKLETEFTKMRICQKVRKCTFAKKFQKVRTRAKIVDGCCVIDDFASSVVELLLVTYLVPYDGKFFTETGQLTYLTSLHRAQSTTRANFSFA